MHRELCGVAECAAHKPNQEERESVYQNVCLASISGVSSLKSINVTGASRLCGADETLIFVQNEKNTFACWSVCNQSKLDFNVFAKAGDIKFDWFTT